MSATYSAVLHDGRLEWEGVAPVLPPDGSIRVQVTVLDTACPATPSGSALAAAFEAFAAAGGPSGFGDSVTWQRETRADRPLLR